MYRRTCTDRWDSYKHDRPDSRSRVAELGGLGESARMRFPDPEFTSGGIPTPESEQVAIRHCHRRLHPRRRRMAHWRYAKRIPGARGNAAQSLKAAMEQGLGS